MRNARRQRLFRSIARLGTAGALAAALLCGAASAEEWADDWGDDPWTEEEDGLLPFELDSFFELAGGYHLRDNPTFDDATGKSYNLAEARLSLNAHGSWRRFDFNVGADAVADQVTEEVRGELREARAAFPLGSRLDMRVGRQVLAWGTGDLLFINDLFPKDFHAFLTGRDEDYLQAPSDAVRGTWYGESVTLDVVWSPLFEPDVYPDGERLTYFDGQQQSAARVDAEDPDRFPEDGEVATRLTTRLDSLELSGYAYRGFFPQPTARRADGTLTHARLNAYGASLRDRLGPGIVNAEIGYYDSVDNRNGRSAPQQPNSEARLLLGYNWELVSNLNVGLQYYLEWLQAYDRLKEAWDDAGRDASLRPEELRDVVTTRLTYSMWRESLTLSLFSYYSPADGDYYLRPSVRYRASDHLTYALGGNLFGGDAEHTFYGQFERDSNLYGRLRYRF